MADRKTLTFVLMDPPYENGRSATALRLIDRALQRGYNVNVFAYEGAVALAVAKQLPHGNALHGRNVTQEDHPNPRDWIVALQKEAKKRGQRLDWVQCGLSLNERGVGKSTAGVRRGGPAELWKFVQTSQNTLVIPTK